MSSVGGSEEARTSHFGNATKPFDPSSLSALEGSETQSTTVTTTSVAAYHPSRLTTPQLGKKAYRAQLHSSRGGVMMARPCDSRWLLPRRTTTTTTLLHMMFSLVCTITLLKLRPCLAQATTSHHANGARHAKRSDYYPHVDHVEAIISTPWSFGGNQDVFTQASDWFADRLLDRGGDAKLAPYLACAKWGRGREAILAVKQVSTSPSTIHPISHTEAHGSCFIASLNPSIIEEGSLLQIPGVVSLWPFLPSLKLAPSLLDHGLGGVPEKGGTTVDELNLNFHDFAAPLLTVGGAAINIKNARGLSVRLAPGMLPIMTDVMTVSDYIREVRAGFMSESVNLEEMNYWSDPDVTHIDGRYAYLSREWRRAASFVHGLSSVNGVTPGDVCGLGKVSMHHIDDDLLAVEGLNHLLPGAKSGLDDDSGEVKTACLMALLSQLAARPEVLRVAPLSKSRLLNDIASAIVQSATITETPLHDAGLDGTGEVIQVVDTGLDETSCYFSDYDGFQIEHGHVYKGFQRSPDGEYSWNGDTYSLVGAFHFPYDTSRRKVVQYIELFDMGDQGQGDDDSFLPYTEYYLYSNPSDDSYYWSPSNSNRVVMRPLTDTASSSSSSSSSSASSSSFSSFSGKIWSSDSVCSNVSAKLSSYFSSSSSSSSTSSPSGGFHKDLVGGHGTHVAGTAAGSTARDSPFLLQDCRDDDSSVSGCTGGCFSTTEMSEFVRNDEFNIETYCPAYACDGSGGNSSSCLSTDDVEETLVDNGGVAPGAKIAFFDASYNEEYLSTDIAGNFLWNSSSLTGAKIHSNSWGGDTYCELTEAEFVYDKFMYENLENLLIFAAGNSGGLKDVNINHCTVSSPALGKNVLTVGSSSAGPSRSPITGADGRARYEEMGMDNYSPEGYPWICESPSLGLPSTSSDPADVDTLSYFSSYGPAKDGRIKPEIVAPGERVFSASSDGTDSHTCQLLAFDGTSMATPAVAGAAALVRQYFKDPSFYVHDLEMRGFCGGSSSVSESDSYPEFVCSAFSPLAASVKAMLLNSADLMGGSSMPDNSRGFGRVHLEAGMPLDGSDSLVLFITESVIAAHEEAIFTLNVDGGAGLELRATLCWIDLPTTALSSKQLQHDLDLSVTAPGGAKYTMWGSEEKDKVNVNERVVVPADAVESGRYNVIVSVSELLTDSQSYSLVVTGAFVADTGTGEEGNGASITSPRTSVVAGWTTPLAVVSAMMLL